VRAGNKPILAAAVIVATAGGFGVLATFEIRIAQASARTDLALSEIMAQERTLRYPPALDAARQDLGRRIDSLRLRADPLSQEVGFVRELQRIASNRKIRLLAVHAHPLEEPPKTGSRFEARYYDVIVEGAYHAALLALTDLSRVRLVTRLDRVDLARAEHPGTASSGVRATLHLAIIRLRADRNVRPHTP